MSKEAYNLLKAEVTLRHENVDIQQMDEMARLYEGEIPPQYAEFFPKNSPVHVINMIRLAWDDLASSVGRFPDFVADPLNASDAELKRVGLLERIGHSYLRTALPTGKEFLFATAWWMVGTGKAVAVVVPDVKEKRPRMEFRDPRTCYPGAKRKVGNRIVELDDLLFEYRIPLSEAKRRGLATEQDGKGDARSGPMREVKVLEYIDDSKWLVVSEFGHAQSANHDLGHVPGSYMQTFSPNKDGIGQFDDQVTLMVAMSRIISQKIAYVDKLLYPIIWVKGHEGAIKLGPQVLNKLGPQGEMGSIAPPSQLQVDKDLATIERFSRILNRNPEVRQGEVDGKGAYVGAKTLESLNDSVDTVVSRYWDTIAVGLQHLTVVALQMDEKYWPNEEKSVYGIIKGSRFRDKYVPKKDIKGRYFLRVEYGFGRGGYEGFLETVQAYQAGLSTKRQAIEQIPGIADVDAVLRGLEIEQMDEAGKVAFLTAASQNQLDMVVWAKLRKDMELRGTPLHEIILKYEKELQAQAQQVEQSPDITGMTAQAPPEEGGPPAAPPAPGIDPAMMV